jgi:hypothetical protein
MADTLTSRASRIEPAPGVHSTILLLAVAGILAIFLAIVVMHPFDVGHGPEYLPSLSGP